MSFKQSLLSSDIFLFIAYLVCGLLIHMLLCLILKRPFVSATGLLAPLTLGIAMEANDIWQHYHQIGLFHPANDSIHIILLRHMVDVLKLMTLPVILVTLGRFFQKNITR